VLVNQYDPDLYDDGCMMFFGSDGFLYFSNGDVGGANDSYGAAQNISGGLFGGVFRIDVNQDPTKSHPIRRQPVSAYASNPPPSSTANYYIPNDNPFLDPGGSVLEEFYALGFRNPWRGCFDPPTGRIWFGDLGEDASEEVDIVVKGGNYQWGYMEGCVAGPKPTPSQIRGIDSPPLYCYPHTQGNEAVIAGFVYRGTQYASQLGGQFIFGDYISERIWAMNYNGDTAPTVTQLCTLPPTVAYANLSSFGLDDKGELYICRVGLGQNLWRLVLTNSASGGPLPAPWGNQDIGTVGLNGSASYSNGVFVVSGSGFDIWDPRDAFQMVYQPWTGDGQITAQVTSLGDTSPYAKAGVMFRNTLTSGSQHALMIVMAEQGTGFQRRLSPDGATTFTASVPAGVPYWVRLNRTGNVFSAYGSTNGVNWALAGTDTINFISNNVYVGLAVTSHNDTNLTTATFANVSVTGSGGGITNSGTLQGQDIGAVGLSGNTSLANGVYSVTGSGADIWGTADAFQFATEQWQGDGQILARVTGVQNSSAWAKAGVMFRQDLSAGSTHGLMLVSAGNGAGSEWRPTANGATSWTPGATNAAAPYWVALVRAGNIISGYGSTDGINWTQVDRKTAAMTDPVYVGLAVTSHNTSALNTSTFDNVTISGPSPKLSISRYDKAGRMLLQIPGNLGRQYTIQVSSNLTNWTNLATITNSSPTVTYLDGATNQTVRFYRTLLAN